jgi:hypothetical protein
MNKDYKLLLKEFGKSKYKSFNSLWNAEFLATPEVLDAFYRVCEAELAPRLPNKTLAKAIAKRIYLEAKNNSAFV